MLAELAAEVHSVTGCCELLGLSRQASYKWRNQPCSARDLDDAHLVNALPDAHADDPASVPPPG